MTPPRCTRLFVCMLTIAFMTLASACAGIKLVGDYDEKIDLGVTELQKATEAQLLAIENGADYASTKAYYNNARVDISSLRIRADATERNSLTVRMLDKLLNNINRLEEAHNSDEGITPEEVSELFRGGFNSQFTAILAFELAKKRGEKPDALKAAEPATPLNQNN